MSWRVYTSGPEVVERRCRDHIDLHGLENNYLAMHVDSFLHRPSSTIAHHKDIHVE